MIGLNTQTPLFSDADGTVYLVLDDFGRFGRAWRETGDDRTDRQAVIANLVAGEYERPLKVIAFNTAEGWARDVTAEIAGEIEGRVQHDDELGGMLADFLDRVGARPGPELKKVQPGTAPSVRQPWG